MPFAHYSNSGASSRWGSSSSSDDPYSMDKLTKQIENANLRIKDAGFDVADSDKRNVFEKFTNLPENQNWFLDTLELLGRGGNAVKNVIDKADTQDVGTSLYRGFSGQQKVSGADLAQKAGVESGFGKFLAGTAIDIATDPTSFIPAGLIAKGVGAVAKPVAGLAKAGYNAFEEAAPALRNLRETRLQPAFESAKDSLGYMFNRDYGIQDTLTGEKSDFLKGLDTQTEASRKYLQEENALQLARTAKAAGGIDTGADVGRIVEAPLRQFEDVKAYEFPDGLTRTENKGALIDAMNANRDQIKGISKDISATKSGYQSAIGEMANGLNKTDSEIRKLYFGLEKQAGKDLEKQTRSNLRDAGRELAKVDSQLNNFGKAENSMINNYKKQIKQSHESNFDVIKKVRQVAPNGIKGVDRSLLPPSLQNFVRAGGKGIDEVANEMGYTYADELIQDLSRLNGVPRKLDSDTITRLAKQEMDRTGATKHLEEQFKGLGLYKQTLQQSTKEIQKGFKKELPGEIVVLNKDRLTPNKTVYNGEEVPFDLKDIPIIRYQKEAGSTPTYSKDRGGIWYTRMNDIHGENTGYNKTDHASGGTHKIVEVYTPKTPLVVVDVGKYGAGQAAIEKLAGKKFFDDLDYYDDEQITNIFKQLGIEDKEIKDILNHPDRSFVVMDRMGTEMARKAGYDAIIYTAPNGYYNEIVKLQKQSEPIRKAAFNKELPAAKASEKAFAALSHNDRYVELTDQRNTLKSQLDGLKGESKQAREAKLGEIKKVQDEIEALKEASRNPVMLQKELPRPERELSQDPKIQQAAKQLVAQNKDIVDLAHQNGIDVPELEGHMYHILSQEERTFKKTQGAKGNFLGNNPSKSILNNRQYMGSAEDINDKALAKTGRRKFEDNAYFAQGIGQQRLVDYIHAVSFRRQVLSNSDFARPFVKGMDIPKNAEVIDMNNYKFLKESGDMLEGVPLKEEIGGQYVVTKAAKMLLDNYQRLNSDEGTKAFLKAFDGVQSFWKRFTLFSPGYHVRNLAGAMFNNSVGGMNVPNLAKYTTDAAKEVLDAVKGKESALFNEYRRQGLSSSGLSQVEFARAGQEPEEAIRKTVERMSKQGLDKVKDKALHPFQTSQELGDIMDQTNRFALYKWAREKKGMTPEEAALKVKEVQFDYSKLTPFEKNVMTRVVPFYRWMKNNIPYQIKSFINDPRKYEWMNKARLNAQDAVGIDEKNMPDYMKESFAYPVYGEGGKGKMLGLNLPMGDLTKLSDPLKMAVDGLTPLIKTPIELSTNFNTFYKKPIQKFEGQQKQFQLGPLDFGIDAKTAYALEQATGQIGRGFSGYLQKPESQDQDNTFRMPTLGINSLLKPFDADKNARLEQLQKLKKLQEYMLYIQQQTGEKPRTVNQIRH